MDQSSSASARRRASGESSGDAAKTRSMSQPLGNNSPSPGPTGVAVQRSYSGATPGRSAFTTVPPASAVAVPPKQPESQPTSARSLPPSSSAYQQQNPFSPKDAGTEGAAPPAEEEPTDYSSDEDGMLFQKRPPSRQKVRREPRIPKPWPRFTKRSCAATTGRPASRPAAKTSCRHVSLPGSFGLRWRWSWRATTDRFVKTSPAEVRTLAFRSHSLCSNSAAWTQAPIGRSSPRRSERR